MVLDFFMRVFSFFRRPLHYTIVKLKHNHEGAIHYSYNKYQSIYTIIFNNLIDKTRPTETNNLRSTDTVGADTTK